MLISLFLFLLSPLDSHPTTLTPQVRRSRNGSPASVSNGTVAVASSRIILLKSTCSLSFIVVVVVVVYGGGGWGRMQPPPFLHRWWSLVSTSRVMLAPCVCALTWWMNFPIPSIRSGNDRFYRDAKIGAIYEGTHNVQAYTHANTHTYTHAHMHALQHTHTHTQKHTYI